MNMNTSNSNYYPRPNRKNKPLTLKQLWNKYCLWIIAIAIPVAIIIATVATTSFVINRLDENKIHNYGRTKLYASYTVQYGDTLWSIAEDMSSAMPEYPNTNVYLKDLKSANNLYSDKIYENQVLQLPYFVDSESTQTNIFAMYNIDINTYENMN